MAVGGALEAAWLPSLKAILAHQSGRSTPAHNETGVLQLARHTGAAVGLVRQLEDRADMGEQHEILALAPGCGATLPGKVAALADTEDLAQALDGELLFRRIDELEPHRLPSLAKKAVARFRISRSWRSTSFSRRSRFNSAAMSSWRSAGGSSLSRSRRPSIQFRNVDSPIPRSAAISRRERPLVRASRTASSRNSGVKRFFGSGIGDLLPHGKNSPLSRRKSKDTKNGASTFDALDEMLRRNGWAFP